MDPIIEGFTTESSLNAPDIPLLPDGGIPANLPMVGAQGGELVSERQGEVRGALTHARLAAIRAREQAATPGPWEVGSHVHPLGCSCMSCIEPSVGHYIDHPAANFCDDIVAARNADGTRNDKGQPLASCEFSTASIPLLNWADAEFAVHARVDIPLLLTEVDDLRRQVDTARWTDVSVDMTGGRIQLTGDGGTNIADLHGDRAEILRDMLTDLINERATYSRIEVDGPLTGEQSAELRARFLRNIANHPNPTPLYDIRIRCRICREDMTGWATSSQEYHHDSHGPIDRLKRWFRRRA